MYRHSSVFRAIVGVNRCLKERIIQRKMGLIAVCQVTCKSDKEANFKKCSEMIKTAAENEARMVFFPEGCDYISKSVPEILSMSESLQGPTLQKYKDLARKYKIWISLGGFHEKANAEKVSNSHIVISEVGNIVSVYRKVHLFDVDIPTRKLKLIESKYVLKGMEIGPPTYTPIGQVGLGICYDLRFPEFSQRLVKLGAEVLTFPSAFTEATGPDHWEVLLRARAIECQCFVVAAAQVGTHFPGRASYGHSMVVDPWGNVLSECKTNEEKVIYAELDLDVLVTIRENMPVSSHQRQDLYHLKRKKRVSGDQYEYNFGSSIVKDSIIFYKTHHTIAFVNRKCVLPGHILVAPIREVKRLRDLTKDETSDLFEVVRLVERRLEEVYGATSSTISIQDGADAGQTVPHLHAHVIPRKKNDLKENDDIYKRLEGHEENPNILVRSEEEMQNEASMLREFLKK